MIQWSFGGDSMVIGGSWKEGDSAVIQWSLGREGG